MRNGFHSQPACPKIVISGRPNVGKSTLFNRLARSRRSITAADAGTTRDIIEKECDFFSVPVTLADTGGISESADNMDCIVSRKAIAALDGASVILLMLDARDVNGEDEALLETMRKFSDKVVLVVNKVDDPSQDSLIWNFHSYGYKRVCAISASHARGLGELEREVSTLLMELGYSQDDKMLVEDDVLGSDDVDTDGYQPQAKEIRISVMGKPNTGKSTLSNLLLNEERSIVSDIAGTTRDIVEGSFEYGGTVFRICDTAGIRRKSKVSEDIEYFSVNRAIRSVSECDVALLVIDCREGITEQDKKIASLVTDRGCGVILVLNKADLLGQANSRSRIENRLRFLFPQLSFAPIVWISALKATGIWELLDAVRTVKKQLDVKVPTSVLNEALAEWNEAYSPPRSGKTWFKILYAVQVSSSPVRFLFIVNKKRGFPESYVSYVRNKMRKRFSMDRIPIGIVIRERERKS